jgi:hypothetical protein
MFIVFNPTQSDLKRYIFKPGVLKKNVVDLRPEFAGSFAAQRFICEKTDGRHVLAA